MKKQELAERYPRLAEMADGDPELMLDLLEMFLIQTPEVVQELVEGLHPFKRSTVYAASHTLKPTLLYLGLDQLSDLARVIEEGSRDDSVSTQWLTRQSKKLRDDLNDELARIQALVRELRPSLS
ncbi:MAG: Hpt domain-containing protein [Bacteroidota bacterium]